jgi:hypothetical protein
MIPVNTIKIFIPKASLSSASMILTEEELSSIYDMRIIEKKLSSKKSCLIVLIIFLSILIPSFK